MNYEHGGEEYYEFSTEQIEQLVDKCRAFTTRYAQAEPLENTEMGASGGSMVTVWGEDLPNFGKDSRDISVFISEQSDNVTINLWDYLSEQDQPLLIGRSVALNLRLLLGAVVEEGSAVRVSSGINQTADSVTPTPLSSYNPARDILVNYTEHPTTPDGTLLTRDQYTDNTLMPVSIFRRLTKGDYDDMVEMLDAGLEA